MKGSRWTRTAEAFDPAGEIPDLKVEVWNRACEVSDLGFAVSDRTVEVSEGRHDVRDQNCGEQNFITVIGNGNCAAGQAPREIA